MQDVSGNNCSIEVEQGRVVVNMEGRKQAEQVEAKDFADVPLVETTVVEGALFYVAKNAKGEMKRCVSSTINDRKAVAAQVAGWIAEGFVVESLGVRDFKKLVVAIEKAEKEAKESREAAAQVVQQEAAVEAPIAPPAPAPQDDPLPQAAPATPEVAPAE